MLDKIAGQATYCASKAEACRELAEDPTHAEEARKDFKEMELRWLRLAQSYDLAESISGYLEWQAQRLDPPPDWYDEAR